MQIYWAKPMKLRQRVDERRVEKNDRGDMATNTNSREARRRKILERGSDRLALITGRIPTLPNSPPLEHISSASSDEGGDFASVPAQDDVTVDSGHLISGEAPLQRDLTDDAPDLLTDASPSLSLPSSEVDASNSPIFTNLQPVGTQTQTTRVFSPTQISSAIAASKRSRLFASVIIAVIVVLSHLEHPLNSGGILKRIASFRPLYLVLLTDLTLVLAWLFFNNQRVGGRPSSVPSSGGNDWTEQAGKALEAGLAMQKAIDALGMDCSVYTIITVCGVSLLSWSGA